jgi:hypothetical protein
VLSDEELEKLNQEFEQYSKTFEEQKETYGKSSVWLLGEGGEWVV